MASKEIPNLMEAAKLRHQRLISITTLTITIIGALLVGALFNDSFNIPFIDRNIFILVLAVIALGVLWIQNEKMASLEDLLAGIIEEKNTNSKGINWDLVFFAIIGAFATVVIYAFSIRSFDLMFLLGGVGIILVFGIILLPATKKS